MQNTSWFSKLNDILDKVNKTDFILEGRETDLEDLKYHFSDLMYEEWPNTVGYKPKLRNYAKFKQDIYVEDYVKVNISRTQRSLFAQLQKGILPFNIETGQYLRKSLNASYVTKARLRMSITFYVFPLYIKLNEKVSVLLSISDDQFISLTNLKITDLVKYVENIWFKRKMSMHVTN